MLDRALRREYGPLALFHDRVEKNKMLDRALRQAWDSVSWMRSQELSVEKNKMLDRALRHHRECVYSRNFFCVEKNKMLDRALRRYNRDDHHDRHFRVEKNKMLDRALRLISLRRTGQADRSGEKQNAR